MLRRRLIENNGYSPYSTSRTTRNLKSDCIEKPLVSEWKLAQIGLIVSVMIVATKLFYMNQDSLRAFLLEPKLISYDVVTEDGVHMYKYAWKTAVRYSNVWLPLICGILTTYFTWVMIYLDSDVPGIQPPSPLSPSKYRVRSGHSFHINYVFAIIMGLCVMCYMYIRHVSIQY